MIHFVCSQDGDFVIPCLSCKKQVSERYIGLCHKRLYKPRVFPLSCLGPCGSKKKTHSGSLPVGRGNYPGHQLKIKILTKINSATLHLFPTFVLQKEHWSEGKKKEEKEKKGHQTMTFMSG